MLFPEVTLCIVIRAASFVFLMKELCFIPLVKMSCCV